MFNSFRGDDEKNKMSLDSSLGSAPQEKSSRPSIGSVLDNYLIKGCGQFCNSCSLCSFNGSLEGNPWFEMIKLVLGGDLDDHDEVVVDDDDDVLDLLPRDPFGMNLGSTFTSISDWIEGFEWGEDGVSGIGGAHEKIGDHLHFLGLSWDWNGVQNFNWEKGGDKENGISVSGDAVNGCQDFDGGVVAEENAEEFLTVSHKNIWISSNEAEKPQNCAEIDSDDQGGVPHDAFCFVLGYLGIRDLLSVELVCKSLCNAVRGDPLLWRTVHIDQPLNRRITDDILVKLTSRAQGTLQSLILVKCFNITDNGLRIVLQSNPRVMKLIVPDCVRLTIEGILFHLRFLKSSGTPGIKHLRVRGLAGVCCVTEQQFEELMELLGASKYLQQRDQKPQFYGGGYSQIIQENGRAIDVEMCPRCQKLRPVYDCTAESCQKKNQASQLCRGCTICIARCIHCGRCIKDCDYEEVFCLEFLCLTCWNQFLRYPDNSVEKEATCTIISQRTMYQFCLYC